jgi:hypothetical protein
MPYARLSKSRLVERRTLCPVAQASGWWGNKRRRRRLSTTPFVGNIIFPADESIAITLRARVAIINRPLNFWRMAPSGGPSTPVESAPVSRIDGFWE